jgi:hypothetical protein
MTDGTSATGVFIGSLAFLAGAFTAVATIFALKQKRQEEPMPIDNRYDGWEENLGV